MRIQCDRCMIIIIDRLVVVPVTSSNSKYSVTPVRGFRKLSSAISTVAWLDSRVVSVLDSGAEGPRFKSQSQRCRVTVLGKLSTPIVPLFTKQHNW